MIIYATKLNRAFKWLFPNYSGMWFSLTCSEHHLVYVVDWTLFGLVVQCWRTNDGKERGLPCINIWWGVRHFPKEW